MMTQAQFKSGEYPGKHDGIAKRAYAAYVRENAPHDVPVKPYEVWYVADWMPREGGSADVPE